MLFNRKRGYLTSPENILQKLEFFASFFLFFARLVDKLEKPVRTDSEVEQTNAYPGSEQHCEVRRVAKFRFVIWFAQFHASVFREIEHNNEHGPGVLGTNVHPGKGMGDPSFPRSHLLLRRFWFDHAPNDEAPNNHGRQEGHHWIQANIYSKTGAAHFAPFPVDAKPTASTRGIFVFTASTASVASIHFSSPVRFDCNVSLI